MSNEEEKITNLARHMLDKLFSLEGTTNLEHKINLHNIFKAIASGILKSKECKHPHFITKSLSDHGAVCAECGIDAKEVLKPIFDFCCNAAAGEPHKQECHFYGYLKSGVLKQEKVDSLKHCCPYYGQSTTYLHTCKNCGNKFESPHCPHEAFLICTCCGKVTGELDSSLGERREQ